MKTCIRCKTENEILSIEGMCERCCINASSPSGYAEVRLNFASRKVGNLQDKCIKALERAAEFESKLKRINDWCEAYPVEIFPEPDLKKAAKVLKDAGMTLDSISASNMRHVLNGIKEIIEGEQSVAKTSQE